MSYDIFRVDYGPMVFEKRVLKKLFGWWGEGVTGYLGRMRNCELNDLYISPNIATLIIGACMQSENYVNCVQNVGSSRKN